MLGEPTTAPRAFRESISPPKRPRTSAAVVRKGTRKSQRGERAATPAFLDTTPRCRIANRAASARKGGSPGQAPLRNARCAPVGFQMQKRARGPAYHVTRGNSRSRMAPVRASSVLETTRCPTQCRTSAAKCARTAGSTMCSAALPALASHREASSAAWRKRWRFADPDSSAPAGKTRVLPARSAGLQVIVAVACAKSAFPDNFRTARRRPDASRAPEAGFNKMTARRAA